MADRSVAILSKMLAEVIRLRAARLAEGDDRLTAWLAGHPGRTPVLVYDHTGALVEIRSCPFPTPGSAYVVRLGPPR